MEEREREDTETRVNVTVIEIGTGEQGADPETGGGTDLVMRNRTNVVILIIG